MLNHRVTNSIVVCFSLIYAIAMLVIIHVVVKVDVYFQDESGHQIYNFFLVSQIIRIISTLLNIKCLSSVPDVNRENRNFLLPFVIWNGIDVFVNIVVVAYMATNSLDSTGIALACFFSVGTIMFVVFIVLVSMHYRLLIMPLRIRSQSAAAFLESSKKEARTPGLTLYTVEK